MCSLAGVDCGVGSTLEPIVEGTTVEVIIRCSTLTSAQVLACSDSCNGYDRVTAVDAGVTYTGKCQKVCVMSHGCTCHLTGCTVAT